MKSTSMRFKKDQTMSVLSKCVDPALRTLVPIPSSDCSSDTSTWRADGTENYQFQFIDVGKPSRLHDNDSRAVVRAHVVRDYYRRKREAVAKTSSTVAPTSGSLSKGKWRQSHRFKSSPAGLQEVPNRPQRKKSRMGRLHSASTIVPKSREDTKDQSVRVSEDAAEGYILVPSGYSRTASFIEQPGTLDPFSTLPLSNSPSIKILLYHANKRIFSSPWMGQLRKEWLLLATHDVALFHIALSHYAGNYGLQHQECDPVDALRFRMESMRIVNWRIERNENALIDGTLGTVASLSSYEATNGSLLAVRAHMNGLKKMVRMRGGLEDYGMNEYTRRLILWADLTCASALGSDPVFHNDAEDSSSNGSNTAPDNPSHRSFSDGIDSNATMNEEILRVLHKDLTGCFADLRYSFQSCSKEHYVKNVDKSIHIGRSDNIYTIEKRLLELANMSGSQSLIRGTCIAAIIFIDNYFRGIGFNARLMGRHVERLQHSVRLILSKTPLLGTTVRAQRAILWILCVGVIATASRAERVYFMTEVAEICHVLGIKSREDGEEVLREFFWPAAWANESSQMWKQVEANASKLPTSSDGIAE